MEQPKARFRDFIAAYWSNWWAIMSSGPSVPAAIAALYVENTTARILLWLTAAAAAILSAFFVWREERKTVIELDMFARREAVRQRVAELITEGAGLRNENTDEYNPFSLEELTGWRVRATQWHNVALDTLKSVSPADAEWYRTLNEVPAPAIPMAIPVGCDEDDLQFYAMHNFRLKKLEQLVSGEKGNLLVRR